MEKKKCTAIVLSAGQGTRMGTTIQKQYLQINQKPVIFYSLDLFQHAEIIDEIILVVGAGQEEFCRREIVEKYQLNKVSTIVTGGDERYQSVWNGLQQVSNEGYVFIHDGARPFVDEDMLNRLYDAVEIYKACVVGMPVKDTIKVISEEGFAIETPNRKYLWMIQTPQVFESALIKKAYTKSRKETSIEVTDDAMVVEQMLKHPIKMVEGSYENIKITTPEDLEIAEVFARRKK